MMKKRGETRAQVTVFIIIGLILLVSASIVIYVTTVRKVEVIEEVVVPPEVQPIYDYVTNCLYESGSDALVLIGMQGGFVDLSPERIETRDITMTPSSYIKIDPTNTFKLPLWFYEGEDRTPPLEFIQGEIARHVQEHFEECIANFTAFEPQYQITALDKPRISSILTDQDVVIRLDYPIEIKEGEKTTTHEKYISHIPVRLKKMWELASAILKKENEVNFFDNLTVDLMAMYDKIPMDGMEFSCGLKTWRLEEVEDEAQYLFRLYIPKVRVKGTDYPPFLADDDIYEELAEYTMEDVNEGNLPDIPTPDDAFEYNRMMLDPEVSGVDDLKVSFVYLPRWGIDLNALPNEAGILRSNIAPGQSFLSFMCINTFHFTYDVIYKIQARLLDPEAYAGEGYIFQFGFPVLIDDNKPNREQFGVRLFEDFYTDLSFCENRGGDTFEIKAVGFDEEGYMMTSGMPDVNISYHCFDRHCLLGTTGYSPQAPGRYALITQLPLGCKNPIIEAEKSGYLKASGQLVEESLDLEMTKLRKMPFTIMKHPYLRGGGLQQQTLELSYGDEVALYIKLREHPAQHEQYLTYLYGQNETPEVEIVDGDASYDMDIMLNSHGRLVGGYRAKNITLSYGDFAGLSEMVFHVFEYRPRPTESEDIAQMMNYFMGMTYQEELKPTFR